MSYVEQVNPTLSRAARTNSIHRLPAQRGSALPFPPVRPSCCLHWIEHSRPGEERIPTWLKGFLPKRKYRSHKILQFQILMKKEIGVWLNTLLKLPMFKYYHEKNCHPCNLLQKKEKSRTWQVPKVHLKIQSYHEPCWVLSHHKMYFFALLKHRHSPI